MRRSWSTAVTALVALAGSGALAGAAPSPATEVPAVTQPLTSDPSSPVVHDTETLALVAHAGHLFAATGQWEYPGSPAYGQILMKKSAASPWAVFEQTQSLRVQALDSFPIPADQGLGPDHSLLVTQAIVDGHSRVQWLLDGATSFSLADSYSLGSIGDDVRAFGAHESGGIWSVYAGVRPSGILRATWSPTRHTLVFDSQPELTVAPPGSPGLVTQKDTGFADCGGALYSSINTTLYRRNDGALPSGVLRWVPVYRAPPVGPHNSGLRGLTCVSHDGSPSLLFSTEGNGDVLRLDHLPRGRLRADPHFVPVLEFRPMPAIRQMLAASGTTVPRSGRGSIVYVIAAYNNGDFQTVHIGGVMRQVFGFEWGYLGTCPTTRTCGPVASGLAHFDASACFAIRSDPGPGQGRAPSYGFRCLSGPSFTTGTAVSNPIGPHEAFVSIRGIVPSPFGDRRLYYAGYDCNFYPADGTAWIASSRISALQTVAS